MPDPTSPHIRAAAELELDLGVVSDDEETFDDINVTPDLSQPTLASPPPQPVSPSLASSPTKKASPATSPSRVKAAAAMWENNTPKASSSSQKLSPGPTFRSVSAGSSRNASRNGSPEKGSSSSPDKVVSSPAGPTRLVLPATPASPGSALSSASLVTDTLSDISLQPSPVASSRSESLLAPEPKSYSLTPSPPHIPVQVPPVPPPDTKTSFFSQALGFGSAPESAPSSRSTSGWRSNLTNLLASRSTNNTSPIPQVPVSPASDFVPRPNSMTLSRTPSTSFLLHRIDSTSASRDRRISREMGGGDRLREGFNRVRGEMESAAREMRREREQEAERVEVDGVDWVFWGAVVQDYEDVARTRPKDLSKAIQQGIPAVIRGAIWQLMSSSKSPPLEETYKSLLKMSSPHEKAIAKDINRTFPNHKFFQQGGGVGQESLFMVVKAYSLYDQEVGYTQGLAFIVAALLLNMPDEEAFCVLVRLMDSYNLRSHFLAEMPGLQLRLFQFDRLLEEVLPLVHTHFLRKGVKSSMFASQWFMTLFSYRFPLSLVYRVLDIVFAEGIEAIFRFSLALLKKSEDSLVEMDFEAILSFLQSDLFEMYRVEDGGEGDDGDDLAWRANDFVRDAYEIRITPFMLDAYQAEWEEQCRSQNRHAQEVDQLRNANRTLSMQVKQLEASVTTMNQEHVELVRQLVHCKLEKEETENELVRYKMLYAELAHAQQDAMSVHSRFSSSSFKTQVRME